jgi:hypothetical protein
MEFAVFGEWRSRLENGNDGKIRPHGLKSVWSVGVRDGGAGNGIRRVRGVTELRNIRAWREVDQEIRGGALLRDVELGETLAHFPSPDPYDSVVAMADGIQLASVNFGRNYTFLQRALFARHGPLADVFQKRATPLASEKCGTRKNSSQLSPNFVGRG